MIKYLYLILAISFEVIGTCTLKASQGFTILKPSILTIICYSACFYFLALTFKHFESVGYVYAVWSGFGIVLLTLIGIFYFKNQMDVAGIIGLGLILLGVIVLNLFSKISV
jgi:small multidrug resistance pump|tara:strand:+ start:616 stop:948 length:333 start_codon:yes stop_codon:yes gene_type:complete